jgi:hypothetical protein
MNTYFDNEVDTDTYSTLKYFIIDKMIYSLKPKYPNVKYIPNRCEFWNGNDERVLLQDVRNAFPNNYNIKILFDITEFAIYQMKVSPTPPIFKRELKEMYTEKKQRVLSLKTKSRYQLSTKDIEIAEDMGLFYTT